MTPNALNQLADRPMGQEVDKYARTFLSKGKERNLEVVHSYGYGVSCDILDVVLATNTRDKFYVLQMVIDKDVIDVTDETTGDQITKKFYVSHRWGSVSEKKSLANGGTVQIKGPESFVSARKIFVDKFFQKTGVMWGDRMVALPGCTGRHKYAILRMDCPLPAAPASASVGRSTASPMQTPLTASLFLAHPPSGIPTSSSSGKGRKQYNSVSTDKNKAVLGKYRAPRKAREQKPKAESHQFAATPTGSHLQWTHKHAASKFG